MKDRTTMIRQQMENTRRNLTEKLTALEQQVTEQVQSAGTAVNAAAEAVQEAVHSVGNALDMERQFNRHPWLFLGGSAMLGYLATEYLKPDVLNQRQCLLNSQEPSAVVHSAAVHNGQSDITNEHHGPDVDFSIPVAPILPHNVASYQNDGSSMGAELRKVAIIAFGGLAQEIMARVVPQVMDYFHHENRELEKVRPQENRAR